MTDDELIEALRTRSSGPLAAAAATRITQLTTPTRDSLAYKRLKAKTDTTITTLTTALTDIRTLTGDLRASSTECTIDDIAAAALGDQP